MMVSTKGRYALRVMLDLAQHMEQEFISLKEICERQGVSMKYLESIVPELFKAGLVESKRGKFGGYRLAKKPEECTAFEIIRTVEQDFYPVACVAGDKNICQNSGECLTRPMWIQLDRVIEEYLSGISLRDILDKKIG